MEVHLPSSGWLKMVMDHSLIVDCGQWGDQHIERPKSKRQIDCSFPLTTNHQTGMWGEVSVNPVS